MEQITAQAPFFMLVFIRLSAFIAFVPFFNDQNYIMPIKVGFAFFISLLLFPTINTTYWNIPNNLPGFIWVVTGEIMIGIFMGLVFLIFLFALQLAGRVLGFQMAFSMATVVDTTFGSNANVLSVMMVLVGTMIIVSLGGDHYLLYSLNRSFEHLAPGTFLINRNVLDELSRMMIHSFDIGFRLAAPAVILLICVDLTLGLIGKTASKMQIFFVGLPLKISMGLFSFGLILGFVITIWSKDISRFPEYFIRFFRLMRI